MSTEPRPVVLGIRNDETDGIGLVGRWLEEAGIEVRVVHADRGEPVPAEVPDGISGIVPMGGWMGATDDHLVPWLAAERALLRDAVRRDIPVLGLCLGGQLLAEAVGGSVGRAETVEVGVVPVRRTAEGSADRVIGAAPERADGTLPASEWHQDRIIDLPATAVVLAESADCPVQAFRIGSSAYGLQFHPEVDRDIVLTWGVPVDESDSTLSRSGRTFDEVVHEVTESMPALVGTWRPMTIEWACLVRERAAGC